MHVYVQPTIYSTAHTLQAHLQHTTFYHYSSLSKSKQVSKASLSQGMASSVTETLAPVAAPATTIQLRFSTKDPSLQIEDRPIVVPTSLRRYGLSEVVNHLLSTETPIPFSFLIGGELLGTTLAEHLVKKALSSEAVLEVEYVRSILPPSFLATYPHDDWVSAIAQPSNGKVATGSYDAIVRVWDPSQRCLATATGHTGPIKDLTVVDAAEQTAVASAKLVSASMDRTLRLWRHETDDVAGADDLICEAELRGHTASVEGCAASGETVVSVSADGQLGVWDTGDELGAPYAPERLSGKRKRSRTSAVGSLAARHMRRVHGAQATAVAFDGRDKSVVYTTGLDDKLVATDLNTLLPLTTINTGTPLFSVVSAPKLHAVLTGGQRNVHVHDLRSQQLTSLTLQGHRNFVSGISLAPTTTTASALTADDGTTLTPNDNLLATSSFDGDLRIWDIRNPRSLYTVKRQPAAATETQASQRMGTGMNKVMCVYWSGDLGILSGGEDCQMQVNRGITQA
ncbi:ribosome bioproteinsis protein ytm1 [Savitreella phatthalungensis]